MLRSNFPFVPVLPLQMHWLSFPESREAGSSGLVTWGILNVTWLAPGNGRHWQARGRKGRGWGISSLSLLVGATGLPVAGSLLDPVPARISPPYLPFSRDSSN